MIIRIKKGSKMSDKHKENYEMAKEAYAAFGVDVDKAIQQVIKTPISIHCWQGDDVSGFEKSGELSGGIQVTGAYPGRARTSKELMQDLGKIIDLVPGKHRINLHAIYAIFEDEIVDRDKLEPKHFEPWVDFAKEKGLGIDFNPTFFSHPMAKDATLSSEDEVVRTFWVNHAKQSIKIANHFATSLNTTCLMNIWIPDGYKEVPADRKMPRERLKKSLDEILSVPYDHEKIQISLESKVFGIGLESYTVGSHEFYMDYAARNDVYCLLDNGHFHPTESVGDKISSMLLFKDKIALHVTRSVRWDSDHVVRLNDELSDISNEIIRNGAENFMIGLDFFDASINRLVAWTIGVRSLQKALLKAALKPQSYLSQLQENRKFSELMMLEEEIKGLPLNAVYDHLCTISGVPSGQECFKALEAYETEILLKRGDAYVD